MMRSFIILWSISETVIVNLKIRISPLLCMLLGKQADFLLLHVHKQDLICRSNYSYFGGVLVIVCC